MSQKFSSLILSIFLLTSCAPIQDRPSGGTLTTSPFLPANTSTLTPTPTEILTSTPEPTPTETPFPMLSENPTAEELAFAKKDTIAPEFTFGGYKWNATLDENNEKVWVREDGKLNFEWVSLYNGEIYNAYMFVTKSERVEGKRSLDVYFDPRVPVFALITGSPDAIDTFVGSTVANYMKNDSAQEVLRQENSNLKIILGGKEYWPTGHTIFRPGDISYTGPNGEEIWQKIWSNYGVGSIGAFVNPHENTVQCGYFNNSEMFDYMLEYLNNDSSIEDTLAQTLIRAAIDYCIYFDPEAKNLQSLQDPIGFDVEYIYPLLTAAKVIKN